MRSWLAVLVAMLVGCNDHGAGKLTKIKNEVCACTTAACAEQAMKRVPAEPIDSNHRTQTLARDMLDCLAKLQNAERPDTDPDAEQPSAAAAPSPAAPSPAAPSPARP